MIRRLLWLCALALCSATSWAATDQVAVPKLESPVTDLTQTLTAEQQQSLRAQLLQYEQQHGSQIAVLIVPSVKPESIEQYSLRVVGQWQLGRAKQDDGVLLLIAKNDRDVRIEVGYGLEGVLTDAATNRIIRNVIVPQFKQGQFYQGISDGLTRIMALAAGDTTVDTDNNSHSLPRGRDAPWPLLLFGVVVGGSVLRALLGRLPAALLSGIGTGLLVWWFITSFWFAVAVALFAFIFVLGGSSRGWSNRGGGWSGGGFGGGGFGGGWSGGGGGFGGGGSSGRW